MLNGLLGKLGIGCAAPNSGVRTPRRARIPTADTMAFATGVGSVGGAPVNVRGMATHDRLLMGATIALLLLGIVMVYSATIALPDSNRYGNLTPTFFVVRHIAAVAFAAVVAAFCFQIPSAAWQANAPRLFLIGLGLLVLVLIPGVGKGVLGARRWIPLGIMNMQPSELMKLFCVLYAADYTVRKQEWMHKLGKGFAPMAAVMMLVGLLLQLEPDMGAFIVIVAIAFGILFIGGLNGMLFIALVGALVVGFVGLIELSPYRAARILAFWDPWSEKNALGKAYQLTQALIAFGRGEWTGVGLGASVQKLHYLPEAHTDFLLAVVGEELGFAGVALVIGLFYLILRRCFDIGRQAIALDRTFQGLVAQGVGVWFGAQVFINMGVNLGLLPTKGLTLPLMSYGGSGILVNLIALAMVLRIDWETRRMMRGQRV
nr:putative lipid II flippase FtsW [Derxia gummosa]